MCGNNDDEKSEEIKLETSKMTHEELSTGNGHQKEMTHIPETLKQIYCTFKEAVKFEFGTRRPMMHLIKNEVTNKSFKIN